MEEGEREGDGYIIPKSMHISTVRNAKGGGRGATNRNTHHFQSISVEEIEHHRDTNNNRLINSKIEMMNTARSVAS